MPEISLTQFVDFVFASGPPRVTQVRHIRGQIAAGYHPSRDFWKRLRDEIVTVEESGHPLMELDRVANDCVGEAKRNRYEQAIKGYKRFHRRRKRQWFAPPSAVWERADLLVRVNPELGLVIGSSPVAIKLYFKKESLSKRRIESILHLMETALAGQAGAQGMDIGLLDVPKGKLIRSGKRPDNLDLLLNSDALAFSEIWKGLGGDPR